MAPFPFHIVAKEDSIHLPRPLCSSSEWKYCFPFYSRQWKNHLAEQQEGVLLFSGRDLVLFGLEKELFCEQTGACLQTHDVAWRLAWEQAGLFRQLDFSPKLLWQWA